MTEDEQPREVPSVRWRWLDIGVLASAFLAEVTGALGGLFGGLTFAVSAHRNWQIDRDRQAKAAGGPIFKD